MILVVFGNVPIPFNRLAEKIDEIAEKSNKEFIVQYGYTRYPFTNVKAFKFVSSTEMSEFINNASIIITHGGYGTISECLKQSKSVIAVPRKKGEHNHPQEELVRPLENEGYIIGVYDINDLENKILHARTFVPKPFIKGNASNVINGFINNINS